jgi:hypothetical protein
MTKRKKEERADWVPKSVNGSGQREVGKQVVMFSSVIAVEPTMET